jgi:hypothetical protein
VKSGWPRYTAEQQREGIEYNHGREEPLAEIPSGSTSEGPATFAAMTGTDWNDRQLDHE